MSEPRMEWHGRLDFAEIAEAIGVPTDHIMAAQNPNSEKVVVLYTTDATDATTIHSILLRRGTDGVLFVASPPHPHPEMWQQITDDIDQKLRDQFGEPESD